MLRRSNGRLLYQVRQSGALWCLRRSRLVWVARLALQVREMCNGAGRMGSRWRIARCAMLVRGCRYACAVSRCRHDVVLSQ